MISNGLSLASFAQGCCVSAFISSCCTCLAHSRTACAYHMAQSPMVLATSLCQGFRAQGSQVSCPRSGDMGAWPSPRSAADGLGLRASQQGLFLESGWGSSRGNLGWGRRLGILHLWVTQLHPPDSGTTETFSGTLYPLHKDNSSVLVFNMSKKDTSVQKSSQN